MSNEDLLRMNHAMAMAYIGLGNDELLRQHFIAGAPHEFLNLLHRVLRAGVDTHSVNQDLYPYIEDILTKTDDDTFIHSLIYDDVHLRGLLTGAIAGLFRDIVNQMRSRRHPTLSSRHPTPGHPRNLSQNPIRTAK